MRIVHALPLAAAILLAACGSGDTDTDGDGKLSGEEVAAESASLPQMQPGQYRGSFELLEFDAPDMSEQEKQMMQQVFASGLTQGTSFCLSEEDVARNGPEEMVKSLGEGDCTMKSFNVSGNSVVADMQCPGEGGGTRDVRMEGQMRADGSTMTMETSQDVPNVGQSKMKMRVTSERIGDCPA